jgi:hypothetical protein
MKSRFQDLVSKCNLHGYAPEAEALALFSAEEEEQERAAGGVHGRGDSAGSSGRGSPADTFIDPMGLDGVDKNGSGKSGGSRGGSGGGAAAGGSAGGGGGGRGGTAVGGGSGAAGAEGGDGKAKRSKGAPLPLPSALESEALALASEEESKRHEIAQQFLEEAAKYGVATEFMCPHAVVGAVQVESS